MSRKSPSSAVLMCVTDSRARFVEGVAGGATFAASVEFDGAAACFSIDCLYSHSPYRPGEPRSEFRWVPRPGEAC